MKWLVAIKKLWEGKRKAEKGRQKNSTIMGNTPMLGNWVQIEMGIFF
jgi:hypothetical protein